MELKGLFNVSLSSVSLDRIQDLTIYIKGILPSLFRFGDLHIQTAGGFREFIFQQVGEPEILKQVIIEAHRDYQRELERSKNLEEKLN